MSNTTRGSIQILTLAFPDIPSHIHGTSWTYRSGSPPTTSSITVGKKPMHDIYIVLFDVGEGPALDSKVNNVIRMHICNQTSQIYGKEKKNTRYSDQLLQCNGLPLHSLDGVNVNFIASE